MNWKTKSSFILTLALAAFAAFLPAQAEADVRTILYIQGPGGSVLVNDQLVVPETCTVEGKDFTGHKAPCAIQAAKNAGLISSFGFIDFGGALGLFLDSINGIATAPDWSESWQLFKNGTSSSVGIELVTLSTCDTLQFTYGPWPTPVSGTAQECQLEGGPTHFTPVLKSLNAGEAVRFLEEQQQDDGSFGNTVFTDWAAIAFGAFDKRHPAAGKIQAYFAANPDPGASLGSPVLSYERRAMALMALGVNPYNTASVDYIGTIEASFDGTQLGDPGLVNDDIFGLLVLAKAGYDLEDEIVSKVAAFVIGNQQEDGSWGGVDMSAASVQALSLVSSAQGVQESLDLAEEYLREQQGEDGGFGNAESTSWAMQAMAALGDLPWEKNGRMAPGFLASLQEQDGGVQGETEELRVWTTSYGIPASLWKPWGDILVQFEKPAEGERGEAMTLAVAVPEEEEETEAVVQESGEGIALRELQAEVQALRAEVAALRGELALVREARQLASSESREIVTEEPVDVISAEQEPAPKEERQEEFAAAAAGPGSSKSLSSGPGQAVLVAGAGVLLFLILGGWKSVSPLLRQRFIAFEKPRETPYAGGHEPGHAPWHRPDVEHQPET
ncbi:MAG: prenyltransferase/squalene oxidase repeat-containing protein [bacterium]|nr:prenyltransferase/squalene oxidase repeat-containing protein [bacterium]